MKFNYKQLTFAREYRGYSQTELSSKIKGLSQSNLSKFEKGVGSLSDEILHKIIDYLDFPESFFEKEISNKVENAHFRTKSCVNKSERSMVEYSNKLIGYIIDQMGESLEFPQFSIPLIDLEKGYTPEYVAQYIRKYLGLKEEPVRDIFSILERNGIIIVEIDLDVNTFDGVSFFTDNGYPVIVVNKNFSNDHKRFTIAHELGHIIMHLAEDFLIPDFREKEKEAHIFAAEFLMPENAIRHSLRNLKLSYLVELKRVWLTSMASIIRRAKDIGCISQKTYTYFNVELSRKGYKKQEPVNVYIDEPNIFISAYNIHKQDLEYTDEELAKAFSLPKDVLQKFCLPNNNNRLRLYVGR